MLKNTLYRKLVGLYDFIVDLEGNDYFNNASNVALNNFRIAVEYLVKNFRNLDEVHYPQLNITASMNIIPRIRFIQRAKTKNIPWSLIANLDELLKNEFGDKCFLLYRPQWNFNYSVITEDINSYLKNILTSFYPEDEDNIEKLFSDDKIHIFSFPFLEKNNVLLNSVLGHEIGHFYHKSWERDIYKEKEKEYNHILKQYYDNLYKDELFKAYENTEEGLKILGGFYREVIPDFYGYHLFGPSIIFSLFDISAFETKPILPTESNRYYPMIKYRIRLLVKHFLEKDRGLDKLLSEKSDCSYFLNKKIDTIKKYLETNDDEQLLLANRKKELELFGSSLDEIIKNMANKIKGVYVRYENINRLFELLKKNIPINELDGKPVDIMEIIFGGWIYFEKINDESRQEENYVLEYQILMRLLLKSLHSSYIHKLYLKGGN
jgi:hypothetical protein